MTLFNSLGSNYDFLTALRMLVSFGGATKKRELVAYLEKRYGGKEVVLTYKGRDALRLALETLGRSPTGETLPRKGVIAINGYTCLAVYEAVVASGNTVRYLDIAPDSLDFSPETLRKTLSDDDNIRAVVIQNTLGVPCDIGAIEMLYKERGVVLIEDLAHSIGARYADGREAGTVGDFVVLSFSQDKVVDAVSGGALIIRNPSYEGFVQRPSRGPSLLQQTKDRLYPLLTWKVRFLYSLGIGRPYHALLRALRLLSTPFGSGGSARSLPGWYCGNVLRAYHALEKTSVHRAHIAGIYAHALREAGVISPPREGAANIRFPLLVQDRRELITRLKQNGVHVSDIWYDAPVAPKKYISHTNYAGECPNAERVSERMLNLPTHINVSPKEANRIAQIATAMFGSQETGLAVRAVENRDEWEAFLMKLRPHSFLQSWTWGELHGNEGSGVFRLGVHRGNTLVAVGLFIYVPARRGSFLLCPHGPLVASGESELPILKTLFGRAEEIAKEKGCAFLRVCPLTSDTAEHAALFRSLGFRGAPIHMHPELAWMLDITKPEEGLLKEMRKTTRYTIKKMEKEGVMVRVSTNPDDINTFWPVYQATVQRQQFTPFKKADLRKEFELFAKNDGAAFFFGEQDGKVVAAAIIIFYGGQAFYHHSGSLSSGSNVSYLLQWRVIQEARRRGATLYNFWGISPADRPRHPWAGLSLFKKGFGGFAQSYLRAQDKPLTAKYWLNYIVETSRRIKRGL